MAAAMADPELDAGDGSGPAASQQPPPKLAGPAEPDKQTAGQEKEQRDAGPAEHHQVLIIGGGVSGLSAASCLVKNGITDFRLLEARGRLGGRVVAITVGT